MRHAEEENLLPSPPHALSGDGDGWYDRNKSAPWSGETPYQKYVAYIEALPDSPDPEIFGMHMNAQISSALTVSDAMFVTMLSMQPRSGGGGGGLKREDIIAATAKSIEDRVPPMFDIQSIGMKYPTSYLESMNTVLVQECLR